ncbi:MAG: hypothetical protein KDD51_14165 [Bdellovibrionales bacterium]|nr:hypothetical protein [Bdellovibrionales bacterium]
MRVSFQQFVAFAIPSLWIYYVFCGASFRPLVLYRQAFANPQTYLDLYFESNPDGPFLRGRSVRFSGYWVDGSGERPVRGSRVVRSGRALYQFHSEGRGYQAHLEQELGRCEPKLRIRSRGETQVLRAAFCQ